VAGECFVSVFSGVRYTPVTLLSNNDGVTVKLDLAMHVCHGSRKPLPTASSSASLNHNTRKGKQEPWKGYNITLIPRLSFNLVSCS